MADLNDTQSKQLVTTTQSEIPEVTTVLSGINDQLLDGKVHAGVAINVSSSGGVSTLMIPDVTGVKNGNSPVYITKPIVTAGKKLTAFLAAKKIELPEQAKALLSDTTIALNAFYFNNDRTSTEKVDGKDETTVLSTGTVLMSFEIKFEKGLISSLTGDDSFKELFDVQGASLRVLRCSKQDLPILQDYVQELTS